MKSNPGFAFCTVGTLKDGRNDRLHLLGTLEGPNTHFKSWPDKENGHFQQDRAAVQAPFQLVLGLPDQDFSSFPVNILARADSSICVPDLQVVVVPVGVDLIPGVHVEHRVQALGGAGVLFELLHLHRDQQ